MRPYQIIEVANCHGGDLGYVKDLITAFEKYKGSFGMKFQPFKFDSISTEDYQWHSVYKELFFDENEWQDILTLASETKDVWLDLFDSYSIRILKRNFEIIAGIKLQASVLYNYSLIDELSKLDLSSKRLIINISSFSIDETREILNNFSANLNPMEFYVEIGFQSYPTLLQDSGLSKIEILKSQFNKKIVFADHVSKDSDDAIWLPVLSSLLGIDVIEKHVMLDGRETKYDHYSSLSPEKYSNYINTLDRYYSLSHEPYVNEKEIEYVRKSILIPLLSKNKSLGETLSLTRDFWYKRSNSLGLNTKQVKELIDNYYVLSRDVTEGSSIQRSDLKKANIAVIIACRLKSSRLKRKALLKIGDVTSVERCIKSALKFDNINHVVLATSTVEEDDDLVNYTYSPSVIFHRGDPEDVIQRYLECARSFKIDVIIRVTADMPYIDNEVCQILLRSHFKHGADYTAARSAAVGTNLEIINVKALERVKKHFTKASYSEYMTWYFQNNADHFHLNYVDLPAELVRDYRMTLDYPEDLDMFNQIENHFSKERNFEFTLREIYAFLDRNPSIPAINGHLTLKYKTDQTLIDTLNKETKIQSEPIN
jgi:spore coat polysaccharide biosynthesis protein SpsF (cytidylyltransferase family)/sialic acid synthase SpsE